LQKVKAGATRFLQQGKQRALVFPGLMKSTPQIHKA
jgi:hypothetical protein